MASRTAGEIIAEGLELHGVRHVFGIPGAKIDAVFNALEDHTPEVVVCRHEQNAAFMAAAVGRLTRRPGVCIATSGPGATNLVTGLATATTEGDPVVALVGAVSRADQPKRTHQSLHAAEMFAPVTKRSIELQDPVDAPDVLANAFRIATEAPSGAVVVTLPQDVLAERTEAHAIGWHEPPELGPPPANVVRQAADLIAAADLPVWMIGARGSQPDAIPPSHALLNAFPMPIVETFQGAGAACGDPEHLFVGRVGLFRNQPGDKVLAKADVVITVGYDPVEYEARFWNSGRPKKIIHLDSLAADWDASYEPDMELRGGIAATIAALGAALSPRPLPPGIVAVIDENRPALGGALEYELSTAQRCHPLAIVSQLRLAAPLDSVVACDVGSNYIWMARHFRAGGPNQLLFSNGQQTLGVALPWAMAASFLGYRAVSVSGDGGFLFSGVELETAVRNGLNLVHVVMRDEAYDMVAFQEVMKYGRTSGTQLGYYDVVGFAQAFGATGLRVESEDQLPEVFEAAFNTPGVVVVDVPVNYEHNADLAGSLLPTSSA
ncbi:MAG: acetolactate synthase AlsS [Candidatus Nanopelagicales bacterium]|nr:acetolactate synthase AlsS [Candidatus Nanopelagicales bacterium]